MSRMYDCQVCSRHLSSAAHLEKHMRTIHQPKEFTCDFDGRHFNSKDKLRLHMFNHRKYYRVRCEVCEREYKTDQSMRKHLRTHFQQHQCDHCGMVFKYKRLLENHIAAVHDDVQEHQCKFCTRLFPNTTTRDNHQKLIHKDRELNTKVFQCTECAAGFEMKEELRLHGFIHFNGTIHTCLDCNQIFKKKKLLTLHMKKHELPGFSCEVCRQMFKYKSNLNKHVRRGRCKGDGGGNEAEREELSEEVAMIAKKQMMKITKNYSRSIVKPDDESCEEFVMARGEGSSCKKKARNLSKKVKVLSGFEMVVSEAGESKPLSGRVNRVMKKVTKVEATVVSTSDRLKANDQAMMGIDSFDSMTNENALKLRNIMGKLQHSKECVGNVKNFPKNRAKQPKSNDYQEQSQNYDNDRENLISLAKNSTEKSQNIEAKQENLQNSIESQEKIDSFSNVEGKIKNSIKTQEKIQNVINCKNQIQSFRSLGGNIENVNNYKRKTQNIDNCHENVQSFSNFEGKIKNSIKSQEKSQISITYQENTQKTFKPDQELTELQVKPRKSQRLDKKSKKIEENSLIIYDTDQALKESIDEDQTICEIDGSTMENPEKFHSLVESDRNSQGNQEKLNNSVKNDPNSLKLHKTANIDQIKIINREKLHNTININSNSLESQNKCQNAMKFDQISLKSQEKLQKPLGKIKNDESFQIIQVDSEDLLKKEENFGEVENIDENSSDFDESQQEFIEFDIENQENSQKDDENCQTSMKVQVDCIENCSSQEIDESDHSLKRNDKTIIISYKFTQNQLNDDDEQSQKSQENCKNFHENPENPQNYLESQESSQKSSLNESNVVEMSLNDSQMTDYPQILLEMSAMPSKVFQSDSKSTAEQVPLTQPLTAQETSSNSLPASSSRHYSRHRLSRTPKSTATSPYQCDLCGIEIHLKCKFLSHIRSHVSSSRHKCKECGDTFRSMRSLHQHSMRAHNRGVFGSIDYSKSSSTCGVCGKTLSAERMKSHVALHQSPTVVCDHCGRVYRTKTALDRHLTTVLAERRFTCSMCGKSFKKMSVLKQHEETHNPIKIYIKCEACAKILQMKHLKMHMEVQHGGRYSEKRFRCHCGKAFRYQLQLDKHVQQVHEARHRGIFYSCGQCDRVFTRRQELRNHSFVHYTGPVFECTACGLKFKKKKLLYIHSRIHSAIGVCHACDECQCKFKTRGGLRKHKAKMHARGDDAC